MFNIKHAGWSGPDVAELSVRISHCGLSFLLYTRHDDRTGGIDIDLPSVIALRDQLDKWIARQSPPRHSGSICP